MNRKRTRRPIAVFILVAVLGSGAAFYHYSGTLFAGEKEVSEPADIEYAVAEEGTVRVTIERPATSEPVRVRTVRAPIGGVIEAIAETGQFVEEGRRLAVIDRGVLERQVSRAELAVEEAKLDYERATTGLRKATANLEEQGRLLEVGAVSREQVESARDQLESAEQSVRAAGLKLNRAELDLETARTEMDEAIMRAPFDGTVLSVDTSAGERVGQNSTILTFGDLSSLRFTAELDEYDISAVDHGMQVVIHSDVLGDAITRARVERISPGAEIVNNIPVFRVAAVAPNDEGVLRPGMSADLQIMVARDSGVILPSRAVSIGSEGPYVRVVIADADNNEPAAGAAEAPDASAGDGANVATPETERRAVETGANDGVNVAILSGLEAGERVLIPETAGALPTIGSQPAEPTSSTSTSIIPMPGSGSGSGGGAGGGAGR